MFADNFDLLKINASSTFTSNYAIEDGDDIYIENTEGYFILDKVEFTNPKATTSIYASKVNVTMKSVNMHDIGTSSKSSKYGAGLRCLDCRSMSVS